MKLLDTSTVVDIDRGGVDGTQRASSGDGSSSGAIDRKVRTLDDQGRHAISMVTVTELRLGVEFQYDRGTDEYRRAMDDLDRLLARFDVYPISRPIATAAAEIIAELRDAGTRLDDLHDVYVGATARVRQLPVLTANVDHFERIENVSVVDWAEL